MSQCVPWRSLQGLVCCVPCCRCRWWLSCCCCYRCCYTFSPRCTQRFLSGGVDRLSDFNAHRSTSILNCLLVSYTLCLSYLLHFPHPHLILFTSASYPPSAPAFLHPLPVWRSFRRLFYVFWREAFLLRLPHEFGIAYWLVQFWFLA